MEGFRVRLRTDTRLTLIKQLIDSLDEPDLAIQAAWQTEAEDRLAASKRDELTSLPRQGLLEKFGQHDAQSSCSSQRGVD